VFLLTFTFNGFAEEQEEKDDLVGPGAFVFDSYLMNRLPGGYFYPFIIENYAPDTTSSIEESNAFSMFDNPRVYFEGDSFVQFNWFYNGFNLNSALNDGSPAVLLPFSSISTYRLQGESPVYNRYGMNFVSDMPQGNFSRIIASSVYGNLGSYWMKFMVQPSHPTERADRLYNERRKILYNYFIDYMLSRKFGNSHLLFAVNYFDMKRRFNDFNAFDDTFEEVGQLLLLNARFRGNLGSGFYEIFGVYNQQDRSNQGAEIGAYPQETSGKKRDAFTAGFYLKKGKTELRFSLLRESETLTPYQEDFSKDLLDTDGDGTYPFDSLKLGKFSATTFNGQFNMPFRFGKMEMNLFAEGRYSQLTGKETCHTSNVLTVDKNPYLVVLWNRGEDYKNTNADAKAGLNVTFDISRDFSILGKLFVQYNSLSFDNSLNNVSFLSPGFDVGLLAFKHKKTKILFSYGRIPYDIRENVNFFLEDQRPHGTYYHWGDDNGDSLYQPGEEGGVFGYTGGRYHFIDENLAAPLKERFLLHFSTPLSKRFILNIKALYKRIKNNFRIQFDRDYGFYESHEGFNLYFFDQPFRDYYLTNNYLEKDPFYAQFYFDIKGGKKGKWFFSFSFMAHIGMGDTAFGNGAGSNDIGILSETQAGPNSWINGYGRLDGDRGFVAKSWFGFHLAKKLWMGISLKYRDGNPFAFMNAVSRHDQWVLYYQTIKAENEKGVKGGPREDYIADVSVRLNYGFRLFNKEAVLSLSFFNLLDVGGELSEYVFSGGTRDAVELQIPRSLRLTLNLKL
jgi:hypothetical protein